MQTPAPQYAQFQPTSILDRAYWARLQANPEVAAALDMMRQYVAAASPAKHPPATEWLGAKRRNDRAVIDDYWQKGRIALAVRCVLHCVQGEIEPGSDDPLLNDLWSFLTLPSWSVSAHLPGFDLPDPQAGQLDLAGCEMAAMMCEILQCLKPWIDAQSATLGSSMIAEVDRRILRPFVDGLPQWWSDENAVCNNWTGVCAGSILAACESLEALGQPRPMARAKALGLLNRFLKRAFTPAGECDEGVHYWTYGIGYAALGWSRLSEPDFRAQVDQDRFAVVVDYPRRVHLFGKQYFSGNDAGLSADLPLYATEWLAGATGSSWLAAQQANIAFGLDVARSFPAAIRALDSMLRKSPIDSAAARLPPAASARFVDDQQAALFSHGPLTVTLAGGNNAENHNHNDLGHFNVWVNEQVIIPDLGAPTYSADFFGPKRYSYLSASSRGHCCPIINGQEQLAGAAAAAKVVALDLASQHLTLDIENAYPADANLRTWQRSLRRDGDAYLIEDHFQFTAAATVEQVIWSTVEPASDGGAIVLGSLKLDVTPAWLKILKVNPADHRLREFQKTLYCIKLTYSGDDRAPLKVRMRLRAR